MKLSAQAASPDLCLTLNLDHERLRLTEQRRLFEQVRPVSPCGGGRAAGGRNCNAVSTALLQREDVGWMEAMRKGREQAMPSVTLRRAAVCRSRLRPAWRVSVRRVAAVRWAGAALKWHGLTCVWGGRGLWFFVFETNPSLFELSHRSRRRL